MTNTNPSPITYDSDCKCPDCKTGELLARMSEAMEAQRLRIADLEGALILLLEYADNHPGPDESSISAARKILNSK